MAVYHANELEHHGILGMKWGVRRFQNPDGTLTPEGKERYYGTKEQKAFSRDLGRTNRFGVTSNSALERKINNSVQIKAVAAEVRSKWLAFNDCLKKRDQIEDEFYQSKDYPKWAKKAVDNEWNNHRQDYEPYGWTKDRLLEWYLKDDGDQGERGSFNYWLKNSNSDKAKSYIQNERLIIKNNKAFVAACKKCLEKYLGNDYSDDLADRGAYIVRWIMNGWDQYEENFNPGQVSIEDLMRLVN